MILGPLPGQRLRLLNLKKQRHKFKQQQTCKGFQQVCQFSGLLCVFNSAGDFRLTCRDWFSLPSSCMAAVVSSSFLLSSTTLACSFSISPSPFTHLNTLRGACLSVFLDNSAVQTQPRTHSHQKGVTSTVKKKYQLRPTDLITFPEVRVSHPGCSGRWPPAQRSLLSAHPSASPARQLSAGCPATLSSTWPRFRSEPSPARSSWLLPPRPASPALLWLSSQPTVRGSVLMSLQLPKVDLRMCASMSVCRFR